jgi:hypothetical protein
LNVSGATTSRNTRYPSRSCSSYRRLCPNFHDTLTSPRLQQLLTTPRSQSTSTVSALRSSSVPPSFDLHLDLVLTNCGSTTAITQQLLCTHLHSPASSFCSTTQSHFSAPNARKDEITHLRQHLRYSHHGQQNDRHQSAISNRTTCSRRWRSTNEKRRKNQARQVMCREKS